MSSDLIYAVYIPFTIHILYIWGLYLGTYVIVNNITSVPKHITWLFYFIHVDDVLSLNYPKFNDYIDVIFFYREA